MSWKIYTIYVQMTFLNICRQGLRSMCVLVSQRKILLNILWVLFYLYHSNILGLICSSFQWISIYIQLLHFELIRKKPLASLYLKLATPTPIIHVPNVITPLYSLVNPLVSLSRLKQFKSKAFLKLRCNFKKDLERFRS